MSLKRVTLMIGADQYDELSASNINLSGLVRDLISDHLSDHKITISVTEQTRQLYDKIVANTGTTDGDIEKYFRACLGNLLKEKISAMKSLEDQLTSST